MEFFFRQYGSGQPILILHGWLGLSDHWMMVAKFLSEQGFSVIVPDIPNHGRSFHTEHFSIDEMIILADKNLYEQKKRRKGVSTAKDNIL